MVSLTQMRERSSIKESSGDGSISAAMINRSPKLRELVERHPWLLLSEDEILGCAR